MAIVYILTDFYINDSLSKKKNTFFKRTNHININKAGPFAQVANKYLRRFFFKANSTTVFIVVITL